MQLPQFLLSKTEPPFGLVIDTPRTVDDAGRLWSDAGVLLRVVRGSKMKTVQAVLDEFSAAFQFPWYFGDNRDAFDECLTDLGWLSAARFQACVVVVLEAKFLLMEENDREREWFVAAMTDAANEWATPSSVPTDWGLSLPFHVLMQAEPSAVAELRDRWEPVGARFRTVTLSDKSEGGADPCP